MGLLDVLMGSSETRVGFEDFLNRFEEGPPSEGYTDEEVLDRYGQVAHNVSPEDYQEATRDALGRLSETDREQLGQMLAGQAGDRGFDLSSLTPAEGQGFGNLDWLSTITGQLHQQPGLLRNILGGLTGNSQPGAMGGILSSPVAKAALAGITAMLVKKMFRSG